MLLNEVLSNEKLISTFLVVFSYILQGSICPSISAKGFVQYKKKNSMINPLSWPQTQI